MSAFYNEIEPYAAHWLRNLIAAGHIAPGVVDERSIVDLDPDELRGYTQCHFFAGIGVWSRALRLAGWPDDRPVWTGSCPCQPFSAAGKGLGHEDERHLWPTWQRLIRECGPAAVFGEQVASADGLGWLDVVLTDMEAADYAVAAADLSAAGYGAPHIRQRLFFVAHAGRERGQPDRFDLGSAPRGDEAEARQRQRLRADAGASEPAGLLAYAVSRRQRIHDSDCRCEGRCDGAASDARSPGRGFWSDCEWVDCRDGKRRPVEPGTFPLAHGATARVGRLRAYGNAIVAPVAAGFISAALGCMK